MTGQTAGMNEGDRIRRLIARLEEQRHDVQREQWAQVAGLFDESDWVGMGDDELQARCLLAYDAYWETADHTKVEAYDHGEGVIAGLTIAIQELSEEIARAPR